MLDQLRVESISEKETARVIPLEVITLLHTLTRTRLTARRQRILEMYFLRDAAEDSDLDDEQFEDAVVSFYSGLNDVRRRGREVALKSCRPFLSQQDVINRLREMVHDDKEKRRLRGVPEVMARIYSLFLDLHHLRRSINSDNKRAEPSLG